MTTPLAARPDLLRVRLDELLSSGARTLDVDASGVPVLPAAALRSLLEVDAVLRRSGRSLRLLDPTSRSLRVLAAGRALHLAAATAR